MRASPGARAVAAAIKRRAYSTAADYCVPSPQRGSARGSNRLASDHRFCTGMECFCRTGGYQGNLQLIAEPSQQVQKRRWCKREPDKMLCTSSMIGAALASLVIVALRILTLTRRAGKRCGKPTSSNAPRISTSSGAAGVCTISTGTSGGAVSVALRQSVDVIDGTFEDHGLCRCSSGPQAEGWACGYAWGMSVVIEL